MFSVCFLFMPVVLLKMFQSVSFVKATVCFASIALSLGGLGLHLWIITPSSGFCYFGKLELCFCSNYFPAHGQPSARDWIWNAIVGKPAYFYYFDATMWPLDLWIFVGISQSKHNYRNREARISLVMGKNCKANYLYSMPQTEAAVLRLDFDCLEMLMPSLTVYHEIRHLLCLLCDFGWLN